jgi:hypothetical protein
MGDLRDGRRRAPGRATGDKPSLGDGAAAAIATASTRLPATQLATLTSPIVVGPSPCYIARAWQLLPQFNLLAAYKYDSMIVATQQQAAAAVVIENVQWQPHRQQQQERQRQQQQHQLPINTKRNPSWPPLIPSQSTSHPSLEPPSKNP